MAADMKQYILCMQHVIRHAFHFHPFLITKIVNNLMHINIKLNCTQYRQWISRRKSVSKVGLINHVNFTCLAYISYSFYIRVIQAKLASCLLIMYMNAYYMY